MVILLLLVIPHRCKLHLRIESFSVILDDLGIDPLPLRLAAGLSVVHTSMAQYTLENKWTYI